MQEDALSLHVREENLPLREAAYVEGLALVETGPWPDLPAIAFIVHRQEILRVDACVGEVVDETDDIPALVTLLVCPVRVASPEVACVRFEVMQLVLAQGGIPAAARIEGSVKSVIAE